MTPDRDAAAAALGIDRLTPEQEAAVDAVERGDDVVVVLPTGAGKSAIYQVAGAGLDGPTIVVSPLIALQEDQLAHLAPASAQLGEAAALHSLLPEGRRREVLDRFAGGALRYLFLAPEQLRSPDVVEALAAARPGLLVVDESHCVVSWGNDFRPAFLAIGLARAALGSPPVLALTASAAPAVRAEVAERLAMEAPVTVVAGVERPNIDVEVVNAADEADAEARLVEAVDTLAGAGLVYVARRADADRLAATLATDERPALAYHSGLTKKQRAAVHERFLADEPSVVVATVAFGLGIDKPDVRWVAHAGAPESIDAWYQELGRAGRDGEPARALLFRVTGEAPARSYYGGTRAVSRPTVLRALAALRGGPPEPPAGGWTVDRLADAIGAGTGQAWQATVELVGVGAATAEPDGAVAAVEPGPDVDDVAVEVGARTERRRALQRSQGEMMRALLDGRGCLWRGIAGYLGEPLPGLCEHCARCREGTATTWVADGTPADDALAPGTEVTHPEFGPGTIVDRTADTLTVAFADTGYKTLDPAIVTTENLLTPT